MKAAANTSSSQITQIDNTALDQSNSIGFMCNAKLFIMNANPDPCFGPYYSNLPCIFYIDIGVVGTLHDFMKPTQHQQCLVPLFIKNFMKSQEEEFKTSDHSKINQLKPRIRLTLSLIHI